ncbi:MAG: DNA polymerase III subunit [Chloroflexi bacterium]|nr:DNA polymerase III subunit [Chloroflexota bacterium]
MWDIIGHNEAVTCLRSGLKDGCLAHAYLFVGPRHVGKMTLAVKLAQALNCVEETPPCGECRACQRIAAGKHADIQVLGVPTGEPGIGVQGSTRVVIGIDQIHDLQRSACLKPFEGKRRAFIIDEAERLSADAANCLLKTLEEPPEGVVIVLLTANERLLLPTIISRCQRLELKPMGCAALEEALVARTAGGGLSAEQARVLARMSRGRVGWALAASQDEGLLREREAKLSALVDLAGAGVVERFAFAARLAQEFVRSRESVRQLLGLWIEWWRDLLLARAGCPALITNVNQEESIVRWASAYTLAEIQAFVKSLRLALRRLEQNANSRLVLETLVLGLPAGASRSESSGDTEK